MISYSKWYEMIKEHLSNYKKNELQLKENGVWVGNGQKYGHILPLADAEKNYLSNVSKDSLKQEERHKFWYHLNSSQTLCVNFFAPLINVENGKYLNDLMSKLLGKKISIKHEEKSPKFEYVPVPKSTNFDFYFKDTNSNEYFFEIKYTEAGISESGGGRTPSKAFVNFYEKDVLNNPVFKNVTEDMFMDKHFQAYRNMVKGIGDNYSIFITMKNNKATYEELQSALKDLKVKETPNIILLYWEELVDKVLELVKDNKELKDYYQRFKKKYIPDM
jgi:hypothetical protein